MPRVRLVIDDPDLIHEALVTAAEAAREGPVDGDVGPWDDAELREEHTLELVGSDEFVNLIAQRLIAEDIGFEVE